MFKKKLLLMLIIPLLWMSCGDDDYDFDYDDEKVKFYHQGNTIIFENNLDVAVVIDNIKVDDKEVKSYIKYKTSGYTKCRNEVVVNYKDKSNQIIKLTSIVLPGKKKEVEYNLKIDNEVLLEFYPVNFNFVSDNIYFLDSNISEDEKRYRLYLKEDIKRLDIYGIDKKKKDEINEIDGIMIFVKEYESLEDTFEELDFDVEKMPSVTKSPEEIEAEKMKTEDKKSGKSK